MNKLKEVLSNDYWEWYLEYKDLPLYDIYVLMCQDALHQIMVHLDYSMDVIYRTYVGYNDLTDKQKDDFDEWYDLSQYGECLEFVEGGQYRFNYSILDYEPKDEHYNSCQPGEDYYPSYAMRNFKRWLDYDELERRFLAKFGGE